MFRSLAIIFLCLIVLTGCSQGLTSGRKNIKVGGTNVQVEIADTEEKRAQGLSGREDLGENEGMLFVFEELGKPVFQTREMKFPLDIIWINNDIIVDISKEAVPTTTKLYSSQEMVDKVLEVKTGFINKNKIKIKDKIEF